MASRTAKSLALQAVEYGLRPCTYPNYSGLILGGYMHNRSGNPVPGEKEKKETFAHQHSAPENSPIIHTFKK